MPGFKESSFLISYISERSFWQKIALLVSIEIVIMEYCSINYKTSLFLLTRFNLDLFPNDKKNKSTRTEEWLIDRFRLFDQFCFPSVLSQSCKDFIWIVLFDDKTPEIYKKLISEYHYKMGNLLPVFLKSEDAWSHQELVNKVIANHKDETPFLLTARVDNDDALHKDFIKNVSALRNVNMDLDHFYSFGCGLQYFTEKNLAIRLHYPKNHYLISVSRKYDRKSSKNILEFLHPDIANYGIPFTCISDTEPMWVEVIHEHNVNNDCIMTLPQRPVSDNHILERDFNWNIVLHTANTRRQFWLFFVPHFISQFIRKIRGRVNK